MLTGTKVLALLLQQYKYRKLLCTEAELLYLRVSPSISEYQTVPEPSITLSESHTHAILHLPKPIYNIAPSTHLPAS
eukprot:18059_4